MVGAMRPAFTTCTPTNATDLGGRPSSSVILLLTTANTILTKLDALTLTDANGTTTKTNASQILPSWLATTLSTIANTTLMRLDVKTRMGASGTMAKTSAFLTSLLLVRPAGI